MIVLDWLVFRTKMGRAMRAGLLQSKNASLMGIDVDQVIFVHLRAGAALAAAAGIPVQPEVLRAQSIRGGDLGAAGLKAFVRRWWRDRE